MRLSILTVLLALAATEVSASTKAALYDLARHMFVTTTVSVHHGSGPTLQHASATVTERQRAYVTVDLPDTSATRSDSTGIEVVVRPDTFSADEPYIIMVYAKTTEGESEIADYDKFLGSFTWHVPPQLGQPSTFYVNAPNDSNLSHTDAHSIEIRLEPVQHNVPLRHASLTVLRATLVQ